MKNHLYLDASTRRNFKKMLSNIYDLYIERIQPTFINPEKEAYEYMEKQRDEQMFSEFAQSSPEDCLQNIYDEGVEWFETLSAMKYRTLGMWISCMCQVWEQQLFSFIMHEAQMEGVEYYKKEVVRGFSFTSEVLIEHGINYKDVNNKKIEEMRLLVNVLKHGEGGSEVKLREMRPDFFERYGSDVLANTHSTLLEETLQVKENDFKDYYTSLMDFWDNFPEHSYSREDFLEEIKEETDETTI